MTCEQCAASDAIQIRRPRDLTRAIRHCRVLVSRKVVTPSSYWPPRTPRFQFVPWDDLPDEGPWDDIVQYYFSCPHCLQLFSLQADTYHGTGGRFGRCDPSV